MARSVKGTRLLVAAAAAVVGVGGLGVARTALAEEAPAATAAAAPAAVQALQPPPGHEIGIQATTQRGASFQIYRCEAGGWTFQEPRATLQVAGSTTPIRHFGVRGANGTAVPHWEYADGSITKSVEKVFEAPSQNPNSIPQLLLRTETVEPGQLGGVRFIQRLNTSGGIAPTGTCVAGQTRQVPYNALYVFWFKAIRWDEYRAPTPNY